MHIIPFIGALNTQAIFSHIVFCLYGCYIGCTGHFQKCFLCLSHFATGLSWAASVCCSAVDGNKRGHEDVAWASSSSLCFFVPHPGALWHKGGVPLGMHAACCWTVVLSYFFPFQKHDVCTHSPFHLVELIHLCCLAFASCTHFSLSELPSLSCLLVAVTLEDQM